MRWGTSIVAAAGLLLVEGVMISLLLLLCSREMMWNLDVFLMGTRSDFDVFVGVKASAPLGSE